MVRCAKEGCNRDAPQLCEKGLCGSCCQPRCSDTAHGNRGAARGRPGKAKEQKWRNAWNESIKYVQQCMEHPGAVKFMETEKMSRHAVFDAIFKMMVQEFRQTPLSVSLDPDDLPLQDQLATLTCILPPKQLQRVMSFMKEIPEDLQKDPPSASTFDLEKQSLPQSGSSESVWPARTASASSSQLVMPDVSVPVNTDVSEAPAAPPGLLVENSSQLEHFSHPMEFFLTGQTSKTRPWDDLPSDPRQQPWKNIKISESATPLHPQTEEATPLTKRILVADKCDAKGLWPMDTAEMVTRHWSRSFPPLYDTTPKVLQEFGNFMKETAVYDVAMLHAWFDERPKIKGMLTGIFPGTYPWNNLVNGSHDFGAWFHAPLRRSKPVHADLCRVG
jgi:hypothetical protein